MKSGTNHNPKDFSDIRVNDLMEKFQFNRSLRDFFKSLSENELKEFAVTRGEYKERDNCAELFTFVGSDGNEVTIASGADYVFLDLYNGVTKSTVSLADQNTTLDFVFPKFANNPFLGLFSLGFCFKKILRMTKGNSNFSIVSKMHDFKKEYILEMFSDEGKLLSGRTLSTDEMTPLYNEFVIQLEKLSNEVLKKKETIAAVLQQYRAYHLSGTIQSILNK
ncbi:MAG: hypothetical protein WC004_02135 [Candidatus Absconditabacterales bacterium]